MNPETEAFVMRRRKKLLTLRRGRGVGVFYGISAYGYPGGSITGVQGNGGTSTDALGPQFEGGDGDAGGSGDSGGGSSE